MDVELLRILEALRSHFDRPITINSGHRCVAYNAFVGGSANSQHLHGRAADIVVAGVAPYLVAELADQLGIGGVGSYESFTHVDSRTAGPSRW